MAVKLACLTSRQELPPSTGVEWTHHPPFLAGDLDLISSKCLLPVRGSVGVGAIWNTLSWGMKPGFFLVLFFLPCRDGDPSVWSGGPEALTGEQE